MQGDLEVRVCGLSSVCRVVADSSWTLRELKKAVEATTGVPLREQRLLFLGEEVRDQARLKSLLVSRDGNAASVDDGSLGDVVELFCARRSPEQARWLEAVMEDPDGGFLADAPAEIRADREVVLAAVARNGCALEFASDELRADRDVVLAAGEEDAYAFEFAASALWADRDVVLAAVHRSGSALRCAVAELQADREVVLAAVKQNGLALRYAAEHLRADHAVVMAAVENDGQALRFADPELRTDAAILEAAEA
eukprot:TRINITY_DN31811_c0_g1_i1.p1 TRINITY_DN31811_c0_g1~~TRINITY_DN31811_c0_g1_i1.p1  ORF type:complete len:254 (-),score=60.18 TRINITY_DN31811_c0_g1_i1:288-1049(-)